MNRIAEITCCFDCLEHLTINKETEIYCKDTHKKHSNFDKTPDWCPLLKKDKYDAKVIFDWMAKADLDDIKRNAWQPIETIPKTGESVMVWDSKCKCARIVYYHKTIKDFITGQLGIMLHDNDKWQPIVPPEGD